MSEEIKFNFSSLLKEPQKDETPKARSKAIQPKMKVSKKEKTKTPDKHLSSFLQPGLEQEDIEILKILAKKYKKLGTNVVRHNQKNPFVQDLARLAFLVQQLDMFKQMHKEGLLAKTKYSGQWSIR